MVETGLLTSSDKEVIENTNKSETTRRQRKRMRDRVVLGLEDFAFLNQNAREKDIKQIFNRKQTDTRPTNNDIVRVDGEDLIPDERDSVSKGRWVLSAHTVAFLWHGLRLKGMSQDDIFRLVITKGIEQGEAQHEGVSRGAVESDISLNKLEAHKDTDNMGALEKWKRDMGLTAEDMQELHEQVSNHPDVDDITGKNVNELIDEHLVESDE